MEGVAAHLIREILEFLPLLLLLKCRLFPKYFCTAEKIFIFFLSNAILPGFTVYYYGVEWSVAIFLFCFYCTEPSRVESIILLK